MTMFRTKLLLTCAASALAASPAFAAQTAPEQEQAQATTEATAAEAPAAPEDETIVVTAQKREEKILDIPQSVTVVSGDTLERQQASTFEEYLNLVPGLNVSQTNAGNSRITLRGINAEGSASSVAIYLDETPFGSSTALVGGGRIAADFDTFDIARVEVLRGPQGTLYGASSLGGVFKYVTNAPKLNDFTVRARTGLEYTERGGTGWNASGVVNVPLGDIAAFRVTGFYRKDKGWVDSEKDSIILALSGFGSREAENINSNEVWGGRAQLLIKPMDGLTARFSALHQDMDTGGQSTIEVDPLTYEPIGGGYNQSTFLPEPTRTKYRLYSATLDADLGFANLVSVTSYAKLLQTAKVDLTPQYGNLATYYGPLLGGTGGPLTLYQQNRPDVKKFTQEIRLASPNNDRLEWLVGAYYTDEKGIIDQNIPFYDLVNNVPSDDLPLGGFATVASTYEEVAGFANLTWHATERFDVSVGGRLSKNKQTLKQELGGALFPATNVSGKSSEQVFTYAVAPRYELNDNMAVYARVAKGYRPGGPNIVPPNAGADFPFAFRPDTVLNYEIGYKADVGRRMSFDVTAFLLKWDDIQSTAEYLGTDGQPTTVVANARSATSKGIEATLTVRPVPGLQVNFNGAYTDAKLDHDEPGLGALKGDRLPNIPKTSFSINADYEWGLGGDTNAFVGGSLRFVSAQNASFSGAYRAAFGRQRGLPGYETLDLRAGVEFSRFSIEAFVRNATNTRGILAAGGLPSTDALTHTPAYPGGALQVSILRPRTLGLSLVAKY